MKKIKIFTSLRLVTILFALSILALHSCKKEEDFPVKTDDVEISEDVINLDEYASLTLISSGWELQAGTYIYDANGGAMPDFKINSILASSKNGGYLRRVTSVDVSGNTMTLGTDPASISDVIKNGRISLDFEYVNFSREESKFQIEELNSQTLDEGVETDDGISYEFNSSFSNEIQVTGQFSFNPHFVFDMEFENFELKYLKLAVEKTSLTVSPTLSLNGQGGINGTFDKNLGKLSKHFVFLVGGVPVVMDIDLALMSSVRAQFDASVQTDINWVNKSVVDFGVKSVGDDLDFFSDFQNKNTLNSAVNVEATGLATFYIIPQVYVTFYKSISTVLKAEPYLELYSKATITPSGTDACAEVNAGIDFTAAFSASIFGKEINESKHIPGPKTNLWKSDQDCPIDKLTIEMPTYTSVIPGPECLWMNPGFDLLFYFSHQYKYESGAAMPEPSMLYLSHRDNFGNVGNLSFPITGGDPYRTITPTDFTYGLCVDWGISDTWELSCYIDDKNGIKSNYVSWIIIE